jgi:hypothetical protein
MGFWADFEPDRSAKNRIAQTPVQGDDQFREHIDQFVAAFAGE